MLNIPESVKELFKLDNIDKNFRVHFPNGEHADLTNNDIDSESVSFTESLSSRDHLQFGLCESPSITFRTIGVGNIRTYEIECSIEIDVSSLAEEPEGTQRTDDVPFPFYRIPYGLFMVDQCNREWGSDVRSVTAYGLQAYYDWEPTDLEAYKRTWPVATITNYNSNLELFMYSQIKSAAYAGLLADTKGEQLQFTGTVRYRYSRNNYRSIFIKFLCYGMNAEENLPGNKNTMYILKYNKKALEENQWKINEALAKVYKGVEHWEIPEAVKDFYTLKDDVRMVISRPEIVKDEYERQFLSITEWIDYITMEPGAIYPYINSWSASTSNMAIIVPYSVKFVTDYRFEDQYEEDVEYIFDNITPELYKLEATLPLDATAPRKAGLKEIYKSGHYAKITGFIAETKNSDYEHSQEIAEAFCELKGLIGHFDRYGGFDMIKLNNSTNRPGTDKPSPGRKPEGTAYNIDRRLITKLMLRDERSLPYDRVAMTYTNTSGAEQYIHANTVDVTSPDYDPQKYQSYTMGRNWIIQNKQLTPTQAANIVAEVAENIKDVEYTPLQCTMKGLPFLESGDRITITADGESFDTYILAHTLRGVKDITDTITSY